MTRKDNTDKIIRTWERDLEILNLVYKTLKVIAKILSLILFMVAVVSFDLNSVVFDLIEMFLKK